ncbi:hypothetical protein D3C72_2293120 [compost metagenome]
MAPACGSATPAKAPGTQYWHQLARLTGGTVQEPLMMDGLLSFGQYRRIIRMNLSLGAGSQFDSHPGPGDSCWMSRSTDPSGLALSGWRSLIE